MIRLLFVDDHPIVLRGLALMLEIIGNEFPDSENSKADLDLIACAGSGEEALRILTEHCIDVVLMDIRMPEMDGIATIREIKRSFPNCKVLVFTTFNEKSLISEAIRVGASGYLLKDSSEDQIVAAIHAVYNGNLSLSPKAANLLAGTGSIEYSQKNLLCKRKKESNQVQDLLENLTQREREIFFLLLNGRKNKEIARELIISEHTVRNYVSNIYATIDVNNRSGVMVWARNHGLM